MENIKLRQESLLSPNRSNHIHIKRYLITYQLLLCILTVFSLKDVNILLKHSAKNHNYDRGTEMVGYKGNNNQEHYDLEKIRKPRTRQSENLAHHNAARISHQVTPSGGDNSPRMEMLKNADLKEVKVGDENMLLVSKCTST